MGSPHEGSIRRPIAPRENALATELHLAPCKREGFNVDTHGYKYYSNSRRDMK